MRCAGPTRDGCAATSPVTVRLIRGTKTISVAVRPHYDAKVRRMVMGISLTVPVVARHFGLLGAIGTSAATMWDIARTQVTDIAHAFTSSKDRRQLSSIVGITQDTQQAVARGAGFAIVILALISLVLAVVNMFPFLPLDGGHVLWSVAEKLRGKRVSVAAMWRFSSVGIVLLAFLVINGVSNDISRLAG